MPLKFNVSSSLKVIFWSFLKVQVTLVAGEPVEVQVRVEDVVPGVNIKSVITGGAGYNHANERILIYVSYYL